MVILEDLEYIYVSFDKIRSIVNVAISLILHQKSTTYTYTQYHTLYAIFLYNFWPEFTSLSLVLRPESVGGSNDPHVYYYCQ